jgi:hypothetical protein
MMYHNLAECQQVEPFNQISLSYRQLHYNVAGKVMHLCSHLFLQHVDFLTGEEVGFLALLVWFVLYTQEVIPIFKS